jgi:CheY-like chemotaxis protein
MRILVVHWDYPAARRRAARLRAAGHEVAIESNESGAAYRKARADRPDAIVLDLGYLQSRTRSATRALNRVFGDRLVYVDGTEHARARIRRQAPLARFVDADDLTAMLERYGPPPYDPGDGPPEP